jgi:CDP-4-dehydro-6-deoxyglucose reductase, E3
MGFSITLQPDNLTFIAEDGETILEAARKHDHKLPHGCCDGCCGLCKGNLLQGTVDHGKASEIALYAEERDAGKLLFCCAIPTSDVIIERLETGSSWDMLDYE